MLFCFRSRIFRLLWGITSLFSFPLAVYAESQDNERILANIKSSLLEYALDNKAYVSANSWISGSGSIEEELLVFNRLDLEDLRFQTFDYGRGERGSRLYNVNDANISKGFGSRLRARKENGACELPAPRKQRLMLEIQQPTSTDTVSINLSNHANKIVWDAMESQTARSFLNQNLVIYEPHQGKSGYQLYFTGAYQGSSDLKLIVSSKASKSQVKRALKNSIKPWSKSPRAYNLEISVAVGSLDGAILWSESFYSSVSSQNSQVLLTQLPEAAISLIKNWSDRLVPIISKQALCHGKISLNMAEGRTGTGSIVGGKDIGLFKGQRFILAPKRERLSLEGLEKGLSMVSLAEVVSVYEHSAFIDVYAGMSELDYNNMVAIPLSHAGIFEG